MDLSVSDIASLVQGQLIGESSVRICGAAGLDQAGPQDASFLRDAKNADAVKLLSESRAGVVFVPKDLSANGRTVIQVKNPTAAFAVLLGVIAKEKQSFKPGLHPTAYISPKATLGKNITVGPHSVIEDDAEIGDNTVLAAQVYIGARSKVGRDTVLYPQVVVREEIRIGDRCIIHAGAVIGSDGYGFFFAEGRHNKIPQIGTVVVEDDVEIGSCTTIDRATTGQTIIKKGTKIDNLVQIAHNVEVGEMCLLVAQSGIAGSATLGKGVVLAGQAGIRDHIKIGDGVQIGGQSGVLADLPAGDMVLGTPAQNFQDQLRQILLMRRLPEMLKDLKKLKEDGKGK